MSISPKLRDAAVYVQTHEATPALRRVLSQNLPVVDFERERQNRPPRFVAVVDDYALGMPVDDICAKYGCSKNTVMRYRRMANLPKRPKHLAGVADQIGRLYSDGMPVSEIAQKLGCSQALVSSTATKLGINRRKFAKRTAAIDRREP